MSLNEAYGKEGNFNTFSNDNLLSENEASKDILDKSGEKLTYDSKEGKDESQFGDNVADKNVDSEFEKVKLSENEMAIDEMITGEGDVDYTMGNEDDPNQLPNPPKELNIAESKKGFSIKIAMEKMDSIIGEDVNDKVNDLLNSLTESEKTALLNTLKKKD